MTIHVDALERSGNVFLSSAITHTLGINTYTHFDHQIETLKSKKEDVLFVVPVRDVLPSIVSAKVYRDYQWENGLNKNSLSGNPDELIKRYTEYTDYLINNDNFFIAPFHEFTKDHNKVIDVIVKNFSEYSVKERLSAKRIIKLAELFYGERNQYLSNFPHNYAKEHKKIKTIFFSDYKKELDYIQENINQLYKRYYREESK
jgi:hypothetical protein